MALGIIDAHFMSPDKLKRWTPCLRKVASPSPSGFLTPDKKSFSGPAAQLMPKFPSAEVLAGRVKKKKSQDDAHDGVMLTKTTWSFHSIILTFLTPSLQTLLS